MYMSSIQPYRPPVKPLDPTSSFLVPNSIIEHARHLSWDELLVVLIVHRRGQGCEIPDEPWEDWTGRSVWQRDQAIKTLTKKGLFISDA